MADDKLEPLLKQIVAGIAPAVALVQQQKKATSVRVHFRSNGEYSHCTVELSF
jgi:hypothetical protein